MKECKLKELKILTIGNSFSEDTMEHVASIAKNLGVEKIKLGNLYAGGCSIKQHHRHATEDIPLYLYHQNDGSGWTHTNEVSIKTALESDDWDWVTIQPGTGDGSRHTSEESYDKLLPLLEFIKARVSSKTKIAFNLTWVGDPNCTHPEIVSYGGDQKVLYNKIVNMVKEVVVPIDMIDLIVPTGRAVQNARLMVDYSLTRDNFHMSYDKGRFLAGLTFFRAITGISINNIEYVPDGVDKEFLRIAIKAVNMAIDDPFKLID